MEKVIFESVVHWLAASSSAPPSCCVSQSPVPSRVHCLLLSVIVIKDYSQLNLTLLTKVCEDLNCWDAEIYDIGIVIRIIWLSSALPLLYLELPLLVEVKLLNRRFVCLH